MTEPDALPLDLDLEFALVHGRSVLSRRLYRWPFTMGHMFAVDGDHSAAMLIVQTVSGGLIGRDCVNQSLTVCSGARVEVRGQGAIIVTGASDRPGVTESCMLRVQRGAFLHYRPELRTLFPSARLHQRSEAWVEHGGALLFSDSVVLHPTVTAANFGELLTDVRVHHRFASDGIGTALSAEVQGMRSLPPLAAQYRAFGTVYLIAPGSPVTAATTIKELSLQVESLPGAYASVIVLPSDAGIAVRMAALDGERLRTAMQFCSGLLGGIVETLVFAQMPTQSSATMVVTDDAPVSWEMDFA